MSNHSDWQIHESLKRLIHNTEHNMCVHSSKGVNTMGFSEIK